jgi:hypothetical protein
MYKTASRRTGGHSIVANGRSPTMQYGPVRYTNEIRFPCPDPTGDAPTQRQLAFSKVISTRLRVEIPYICDIYRDCMEAFLEFYGGFMSRYNSVETKDGREELIAEIRAAEDAQPTMTCSQQWVISR